MGAEVIVKPRETGRRQARLSQESLVRHEHNGSSLIRFAMQLGLCAVRVFKVDIDFLALEG
jgi:hypothetical protein